MWEIQETKEFSSEDKKIRFDNLLDSIKSKDIKQYAADFDILKGSVDELSRVSLEKLYASQLQATKGFTGVRSVIKTYNAEIQGNGIQAQTAFSGAVSQTNSNLGKYLANLKNGANATLPGYAASLGKAAAKTELVAASVNTSYINQGQYHAKRWHCPFIIISVNFRLR